MKIRISLFLAKNQTRNCLPLELIYFVHMFLLQLQYNKNYGKAKFFGKKRSKSKEKRIGYQMKRKVMRNLCETSKPKSPLAQKIQPKLKVLSSKCDNTARVMIITLWTFLPAMLKMGHTQTCASRFPQQKLCKILKNCANFLLKPNICTNL